MEISIKSGEAKTMGHLEHNGIAILVNRKKRFNFIHYWNINNADLPDTKWPGEKFSRTVAAENAEASRYYVKNFCGFEKLNCLITNRRGKKFCKNENCDKNVILKRLEKLAAPIFYSIQWIL